MPCRTLRDPGSNRGSVRPLTGLTGPKTCGEDGVRERSNAGVPRCEAYFCTYYFSSFNFPFSLLDVIRMIVTSKPYGPMSSLKIHLFFEL
jgi:hypothetical protein